jgi:hypothetical protein
MRGIRAGLAALLAICCLTGCGLSANDAYARYELGPARSAVAGAIEATGGLAAWKDADAVGAHSVLTLYDEHGRGRILGARLRMDITAGKIAAVGSTPAGEWTAAADHRGRGRITGGGFDEAAGREIVSALCLLAHRLRGPVNLLEGPEKPQSAEPTRLAGLPVTRVGVAGGSANAVAYYFSSTEGVLAFVTAGADEPGASGTVTTYDYPKATGGLLLPRKLRVVKVGRHVLIGTDPVMEVELTGVRMN